MARRGSNRLKWPLRKIVGTFSKDHESGANYLIGKYELLECGHLGRALVSVNVDMYGTKSANRRRCRECFDLITSK